MSQATGPKRPNDEQAETERQAKNIKFRRDSALRLSTDAMDLIPNILTDIENIIKLRHPGPKGPEEMSELLRETVPKRIDYLYEIRLNDYFHSNHAGCGKRIRAFLKTVINDKQYHAIRAVWQDRKNLSLDRGTQLLRILDTLGWQVLMICLHSRTFEKHFLIDYEDREAFEDKLDAVFEEKATIEFYARTRCFEWLEHTPEQIEQDILFRHLRNICEEDRRPNLGELNEADMKVARQYARTQIHGFPEDVAPTVHHHLYAISEDDDHVRAIRARFSYKIDGIKKRVLAENIDDCLFVNRDQWDQTEWPIPDEPQFRSSYDPVQCEACGKLGKGEGREYRPGCACTVQDLKNHLTIKGKYMGDRIEIRKYGKMGFGIRALQDFKRNSFLGEYTGQIQRGGWPYLWNTNRYAYSQGQITADGEDGDALQIDAAVYGNWTRYINHSCRPHASFHEVMVGNKRIVALYATRRAIAYGEQITIGYGRDYFYRNLDCRCGEDVCMLWNAKEGGSMINLGEARKLGVEPGWATVVTEETDDDEDEKGDETACVTDDGGSDNSDDSDKSPSPPPRKRRRCSDFEKEDA